MVAGSTALPCAKRALGMKVAPPTPVSTKETTRADVMLTIVLILLPFDGTLDSSEAASICER
jgi:hypothetical protein